MENSSNPLDVFCGCLVCLTLPVVFLTLKSLMGSRANLSLLFGFGTINAEQPVHVGKTSFLGFVAAAVFLVFSLVTWGAIQAFSLMPLSMGLVLFASVVILVVTFRYLQLAIQLDRQGTSQPAQLDNVLSENASDGEGGNITRTRIKYSYANRIENEIPLDIMTVQALQRKAANLRVVYLDDRPLIHRVTWEISQNIQSPLARKSTIPRTGTAESLIPSSLAEFAHFPAGSFIIFWHRKTNQFVQFLMLGDSLMLDFSMVPAWKADATTMRAHEFFAARNVKMETEKRGGGAYRMEFPPTPDEVEKASEISREIFSKVFLLPEDSQLEIELHEEGKETPQASLGKNMISWRLPTLIVILAISFLLICVSLYFFGQYYYWMKNRVAVEGQVIALQEKECFITSGESTYKGLCYSASIQYASKEGDIYLFNTEFSEYHLYKVRDKIAIYYLPGHPEAPRPFHQNDFSEGVVFAAFGFGTLIVGLLLLYRNSPAKFRRK